MALLRRLIKAVLPPPVTIRLRAAFKRHEPEQALLPALCDPTRSGLDIGAALGAYSWPMAKFCSRCIAFEPNPDQARYLRQAFGGRVQVENLALSDRDGEIALLIPLSNGNDRAGQATISPGPWLDDRAIRRVTVAMRTLDGLGLDGVGFIKLDVEGHELAVLEGGRALLVHEMPTVLVELEERFGEGSIARTRGLMEELGYHGLYLDGATVRPIANFDPQRHQQMAHWGKEGLYINNFIFIAQNGFDAACERLHRLGYPVEA